MSSMLQGGDKAKFLEFPSAVYAMHPYDAVLKHGETIGISTWIGYTVNAGRFLALAKVDAEHARPGPEVTQLWGEPDGGTAKPTVERHVQTEIKAVVAPVPYSEVARDSYAEGWRNKALASA
jgi:syringate O-demethylase